MSNVTVYVLESKQYEFFEELSGIWSCFSGIFVRILCDLLILHDDGSKRGN